MKHICYLLGMLGLEITTVVLPIMHLCKQIDMDLFTWTLFGKCLVVLILSKPLKQVWTILMVGEQHG